MSLHHSVHKTAPLKASEPFLGQIPGILWQIILFLIRLILGMGTFTGF